MPDLTQQLDPRTLYPTPPMPEQKQQLPGTDAMILPKPDHGEESYKGSGKLQGRAALITGGDSGIGRAVAIAFAREGADLLIAYHGGGGEDKDAQETARIVQAAGRRAVLVPGDISDQQHCKNLVQRAVSELGKLDILVNNAAVQYTHQEIQEFTQEEIEYIFRTNLFSQFYLCQEALNHMKPGGSIINTSSVEAYEPDAMLFPYAASKAGIVNLTKSLSKKAIEKGVRVNSVAPGPVWTPLVIATMPPQQITKFGQDSTIGRPAQPVELSPVYVLLASTEASYITGQVYGVTGGTPIA